MGPWVIAGLVGVAAATTKTGKACLKKALKAGIHAGYDAKDAVAGVVEKTKEYKDDLVAEIKADLAEDDSKGNSHKKVGTKSKAAATKADKEAS